MKVLSFGIQSSPHTRPLLERLFHILVAGEGTPLSFRYALLGFRDLPVVQGNLSADGLRRDKRPAAAHHPGQQGRVVSSAGDQGAI
jgi:hypothetical protein